MQPVEWYSLYEPLNAQQRNQHKAGGKQPRAEVTTGVH
jgi:hypothetical protein